MITSAPLVPKWTAESFLEADQNEFGSAWRYELIDDQIIGQAAPSPRHGAIIAGLSAALAVRLRGHKTCRPEAGSAATPRRQQRSTALIPDVMVRCGDLPTVLFEVVSPTELKDWRARDRKRLRQQDVEGVREIIEIHQADVAAHIYRRLDDGEWSFTPIGGDEAVLSLTSIGTELPMSEIYEFVQPED